MTPAPSDPLRRLDVSRETLDRLRHFEALVQKWSKRINLVSRNTLGSVWERHILDSVQVLDLAPDNVRKWMDIGAGGGFPGIVVAILADELKPKLHVTLVESDLRKCVFLRTVGRELGLNTAVINDRVETIDAQNAEVVSARALAPLADLIDLAHRHLAPNGTMIFPKGRDHEAELRKALETWRFRCEKFPSVTDEAAVILRLTEIERAG